MQITKEDMLKLLKTDKALIGLDILDSCQKIRDNLGTGGCIVLFLSEEDPVCTWVSLSPFYREKYRWG